MTAEIKRLHDHLGEYLSQPDVGNELPLFHRDCREKTEARRVTIGGTGTVQFTNEFWTSRQRQACSLHEISYRACFKAQLPRFFIKLLTEPGDTVYDPFAGRGTTATEAALLGRKVVSNDINPLSKILTMPRFFIPRPSDLESRLAKIGTDDSARAEMDLSMFYHPKTEAEIVSLKNYLLRPGARQSSDTLDMWIRMVATNRLSGHSPGFFSVYTLPPNQAASRKNQKKINAKRGQKPEYRDTKALILKKSQSLIKDVTMRQKHNLREAGRSALLLTEDAARTRAVKDASVKLTVTSPPFLDEVDYARDNWLRCWFNGYDIDELEKAITTVPTIEEWSGVMAGVFCELYRITATGGWVAFEVGEVKKGKVQLERYVPPLGTAAGFQCAGILINQQSFTKTSNIWGVKNNKSGTNTNRIVLFYKE